MWPVLVSIPLWMVGTAAQVWVGHEVWPAGTHARVLTTLVLESPDTVLLKQPVAARDVRVPEGVVAQTNARGETVGFVVPQHASPLVMEWTLPMTPDGALVLPQVQGDAPTRVVLQDGWTHEPLPGWERHVGYTAPPIMTPGARHEVDQNLGDRIPNPRHARIYADSQAPLRLVLRSPDARRAQGLVGAVMAAVAGLLGLWAWQKRLRRASELHHAEHVIARDWPGDPSP